MTEQTFHITGLDPRSALCGRSGRIWAAPRWPGDDDMRSGRFVRCRDCDRMFTAALETAIKKARDLEHAALTAYRSGWREGCEQLAGTGQPGRTPAEGLVRECRELGRRAGAKAARLVRDAQCRSQCPGAAEPDGAAVTAGAAE